MKAEDATVHWRAAVEGTPEIHVRDKRREPDRRDLPRWEPLTPPGEPGSMHTALHILLQFHAIVVRDGVPVQQAHKAFLRIDEYRARIAPDVEGADAEPGEM